MENQITLLKKWAKDQGMPEIHVKLVYPGILLKRQRVFFVNDHVVAVGAEKSSLLFLYDCSKLNQIPPLGEIVTISWPEDSKTAFVRIEQETDAIQGRSRIRKISLKSAEEDCH